MLTGQLHPYAGKATLLGYDVARNADKVQSQIGVCFEQTNLYEQMSAIENLNLFAALFDVEGFDGYAAPEKSGACRQRERTRSPVIPRV